MGLGAGALALGLRWSWLAASAFLPAFLASWLQARPCAACLLSLPPQEMYAFTLACYKSGIRGIELHLKVGGVRGWCGWHGGA